MFVKHSRVGISHLWTSGGEFGHNTNIIKMIMKDVLSVQNISILYTNLTLNFLSFIGIKIICLKNKHNCFFSLLTVATTSCC